MAQRMLIDATHPEETRVTVVDGNRLEEFDFESTSKAQLKGNIYLAKVTRVEPSLQAAFVEYGGNRHGFLAFSEIHPDYFRVPVGDRDTFVEEMPPRGTALDPEETEEPDTGDPFEDEGEPGTAPADAFADAEGGEAPDGDTDPNTDVNGLHALTAERDDVETIEAVEAVEPFGDDDAEEVVRAPKPRRNHRSYKIQEVIKRRQIMLVQVTKEERGTKGAALTTYLSLAGRYCVLMPNTPRGGGVSRKIANPRDRKKMKEILGGLQVPDGMAVILRTAGLERTKAEIKRDLDYLLRLWDSIRELTLSSIAPCLIHAEGDLIKRAIRDLYTREIDEVLVSGQEGYRVAKDFMKMLMPSHARKVHQYKEEIPLFHRYQVESQIEQLHEPVAPLRSGGYLVINPTEALVAVDVNSGRATRERNIEETAYRTNLEAADEAARQLRLRDLAGLIVIDFIDMEEDRHNAAVERRLREAMKQDRARIQIGKISGFGLLELSRQRLRPSFAEMHFEACPTCGGTGFVRSVGSSALHILRAIEEEGIRRRSAELTLYMATDVAVYLLNQKRHALAEVESRYDLAVHIARDDGLRPPEFRLERLKARVETADGAAVQEATLMAQVDAQATDGAEAGDGDQDKAGRRKSRRRRKPRREEEAAVLDAAADEARDDEEAEVGEDAAFAEADDGDDKPKKRRRRGKRGGRRRAGQRGDEAGETMLADDAAEEDGAAADDEADDEADDGAPAEDREPVPGPLDVVEPVEGAVAAAPDAPVDPEADQSTLPPGAATADAGEEPAAPAMPDQSALETAATAEEPATIATETAPPVAAETVEPTEPPAKSPRRRRTRKTVDTTAAEALAAAPEAVREGPELEEFPPPDAVADPPPKRSRRPRRKPAAEPEAAAPEAAAPEPIPVVEAVPAADGREDAPSAEAPAVPDTPADADASAAAAPEAAPEVAVAEQADDAGDVVSEQADEAVAAVAEAGAPVRDPDPGSAVDDGAEVSPDAAAEDAPVEEQTGGVAAVEPAPEMAGQSGAAVVNVNRPPPKPKRGWWQRLLDG